MPHHPAFAPDRVAVVTGAASGIGLALARRFATFGMRLCLADVDEAALQAAAATLPAGTLAIRTDVSQRAEVDRLRDAALAAFGEVAVLVNNAGLEGEGTLSDPPDAWHRILNVNLWGVINGVQAFAPAMVAQGRDGAIINVGSKEGITTPPGNTAYNASKAAVKVVTEGLAYDLRNTPGCRMTAHLLVPGFVFTPLTRRGRDHKPDAAWTPEQLVDYALPRIGTGDFYILCPDNDVSSAMDAKRVRWAADDVALNRPALSRWHPDHADAFAEFMKA